MILNKSLGICHISGMLKVDKQNIRNRSKKQGYISGICFLVIFFAAFLLIWNVVSLLEERYQDKLLEFQSLGNLSGYDIRADIYAYMETSTNTVNTFKEDVYINGNRIYLDETGELYIQRGE